MARLRPRALPARVRASAGPQAVEPGRQFPRRWLRQVRHVGERRAVENQHVEAGIVGAAVRQEPHEISRGLVVGQEPGNQQAARRGVLSLCAFRAKIGDDGQAAVPAQAEPGAAGLEVAAGEQVGGVGPPLKRRGRPGVELVALSDEHQRVGGVNLIGRYQKAHRLGSAGCLQRPLARRVLSGLNARIPGAAPRFPRRAAGVPPSRTIPRSGGRTPTETVAAQAFRWRSARG
jgi:hypothetical protein